MTQVADLLCSKGTFVGPQLKVGVLESLKDLAKSSEMLLPSGGEDNNIVEIKQARLSVEAGKDAVHEAGEGGRSVTKTEGDLVELIQLAAASPKSGLCLVLLGDGHLSISALEVKG